ncbi:MAG TPA: hypothetical protein VGZ90_09550 [Puia sp.]|jgi:hypothetical protein|nr:hypothetical protein [Puia sp.]
MRSTILTLAFLLNAAWLFSQEDVFSNKTNVALEKVIRDYPNRFHNIRGDMISQHAQMSEYKSTISVPGASYCSILKYTVANNDVYNWNCTTFNSTNFMQARARFKEIYEQIENTIIKIEGQKPFILNAQYRTPTELHNFNSINFELLPVVEEMRNVKIDLSLEKESNIWKVKLSVYEGERRYSGSTAAIQ